jgi:hypothetical protein
VRPEVAAIAAGVAAIAERLELARGPAGKDAPDRTEEVQALCSAWIDARTNAARVAIEAKLVALVDDLTDKRAVAAAEAAVAIAIAPLPDVIEAAVDEKVAAIPRIEGKPGRDGKDAVAKDGAPGKPGLVWRRQWKQGRTYVKGDAVESEGSSYIVIAETTREKPSESARDWDLLAKAGKDGKPGVIVVGGGASSGNGGVAGSVAWDDVTGKPATFPPSDHEHPNYLARLLALEEEAGIALTITNTAPNGSVGVDYAHTYTRANGTAPFVWSTEGLPDGWALSEDGELTATAPAAETFEFTVTVTDAVGRTASLDEELTVQLAALLDTFTDDDGTVITAHTPEAGGPWAGALGKTAQTFGGVMTGPHPTDSRFCAVAEAGQSDGVLTLHAAGDWSETKIIFRYVDDNNHLFATRAFGETWSLVSVVAGSESTLASANLGIAQPSDGDVVTVLLDGDDISFQINGGTALEATSSVHNTATKFGVFVNTSSTAVGVDSISLE